MIFHIVPFVIAFAVNLRIAVTSRDNQIKKNVLNHELNPMNGAHFVAFRLLKFHKSCGLRS